MFTPLETRPGEEKDVGKDVGSGSLSLEEEVGESKEWVLRTTHDPPVSVSLPEHQARQLPLVASALNFSEARDRTLVLDVGICPSRPAWEAVLHYLAYPRLHAWQPFHLYHTWKLLVYFLGSCDHPLFEPWLHEWSAFLQQPYLLRGLTGEDVVQILRLAAEWETWTLPWRSDYTWINLDTVRERLFAFPPTLYDVSHFGEMKETLWATCQEQPVNDLAWQALVAQAYMARVLCKKLHRPLLSTLLDHPDETADFMRSQCGPLWDQVRSWLGPDCLWSGGSLLMALLARPLDPGSDLDLFITDRAKLQRILTSLEQQFAPHLLFVHRSSVVTVLWDRAHVQPGVTLQFVYVESREAFERTVCEEFDLDCLKAFSDGSRIWSTAEALANLHSREATARRPVADYRLEKIRARGFRVAASVVALPTHRSVHDYVRPDTRWADWPYWLNLARRLYPGWTVSPSLRAEHWELKPFQQAPVGGYGSHFVSPDQIDLDTLEHNTWTPCQEGPQTVWILQPSLHLQIENATLLQGGSTSVCLSYTPAVQRVINALELQLKHHPENVDNVPSVCEEQLQYRRDASGQLLRSSRGSPMVTDNVDRFLRLRIIRDTLMRDMATGRCVAHDSPWPKVFRHHLVDVKMSISKAVVHASAGTLRLSLVAEEVMFYPPQVATYVRDIVPG